MLVILAVEIFTVVEAFMVNTYWYSWTELLQSKRNNYRCTQAALEIDLTVVSSLQMEEAYTLNTLYIYIGTIALFILTFG